MAAAIVAGTLVDVAPPPRPDAAVVRERAAEALADDVIRWIEQEDETVDRAQVIADLLSCYADWGDGYAAARALDRKGWLPNAELVEILEGAGALLHAAQERAMAEWATANNVRLTLEVGAAVEIELAGETQRRRGTVWRIEPKTACYVVNVPGLSPQNGGYVIEGEKVLPIAAPAAPIQEAAP